MNKYQKALDNVEIAPSFMGGNDEYRRHLDSSAPFLKDIATLQELVDKETRYQSLEEELGIDLITLFKALKDGIWISLDNVFFNTLIYKSSSDLSLKFYLGKWYIAYYHSLNGGRFYLDLKDFNKTWWLEKPKENDDD